MKKIVVNSALGILMAGVFTSCGGNNSGSSESNQASDTASTSASANGAKRGIEQSDWGESDGKKVFLYTLTNKNGVQVKISNYGGLVTSFVTPTKTGASSSVVLGFEDLESYKTKSPFFGATVGRYGNRIADGKFILDGKTYTLAKNNGKNSLHGGKKGFDKVVWDVAPLDNATPSLTINYLSKDGEEGFPGNLKVSVKFTLSDADELSIEYNAETDKATPINLTNHSYWNLTGDAKNTILDHLVMIDADRYTPVDTTLIPTGELAPVKGTPFDFTTPHTVGERISSVPGGGEHKGYDHNFVLNHKMGSMDRIAEVKDPMSGRKLEVYTTEPGVQFYSGNFLDGTITTSYGTPIQKHAALCLETQHFPDSPNKPQFPSTILRPGEKYHTTTKYKVVLEK